MGTHVNTIKKEKNWNRTSSSPGFVWFLGFIGALIYYIQQADNFGDGVIGFFKAIVWPAILVYKLMG